VSRAELGIELIDFPGPSTQRTSDKSMAENTGWEKAELEDFRKSFGFGFRSLDVTRSEPPVECSVRLHEGASVDVILTRSGLSVSYHLRL
jgi:hypothetical protein